MKDDDFTAMVSSKILHDLAGPIGAIMNGAELLEEGSGMVDPKEIVALLKSSTEQLNAMLQVFRVAYGAMTTGGDEIEAKMVLSNLETFAAYKSFGIHWELQDAMLHKNMAKIIMNATFMLAEPVRKKGDLHIACSRVGGAYNYSVAALGENVKFSEELIKIVNEGAEYPLTTRNMPAYVIRGLSKEMRLESVIEEVETGFILKGSPA